MLYFPWRKEPDLIGDDNTYLSKFEDPSVNDVVQRNQAEFEPFAETLDGALEFIRNNPQYSTNGERFDTFNEQQNSEDQAEFIYNSLTESICSAEEHIAPEDIINQEMPSVVSTSCMSSPVHCSTQSAELADDMFCAIIRSLNAKQRYAYEIILKWCGDKVKNLSSLQPVDVNPIYLFISGGAGGWKKSSYQSSVSGSSQNLQTWLIRSRFTKCSNVGTNWCCRY